MALRVYNFFFRKLDAEFKDKLCMKNSLLESKKHVQTFTYTYINVLTKNFVYDIIIELYL